MRTVLPSLLALAAALPAAETPATPAPQPSAKPGLRLVDLSLVVMTAAGGSTARNEELETLQIGGHDPKRSGFSFQSAELSIAGAVDPYFTAEAKLVASPAHGVELEEAFATSTGLPGGLEVKAGYFLTEFGRTNPTHPHSWSWIDRSLPAARLLGGEGMRGAGARLDWVAPTDQYLRIGAGVQNADDDTMTSFLGAGHEHEEHAEEEEHAHGIGGLEAEGFEPRRGRDYLWTTRAVTAWDVSSDATVQLGVSGALGPNLSGEDGRTVLYGADATVRVRTGAGVDGAGDLLAGIEFIGRSYRLAERTYAEGEDIGGVLTPTGDTLVAGGDTLRDQGLGIELTYGIAPRWQVGVRGEWLGSSGDDWHVHELSEELVEEVERESADETALRSARTRVSPLVAFLPSEFTKLRLQYAYDRAEHLEDPVHSVWLGLEVLIGAHPAHGF